MVLGVIYSGGPWVVVIYGVGRDLRWWPMGGGDLQTQM